MNDDHDPADDVRPFGKASLRFVAGQGWVQVPHLFQVTLRPMSGRGKTYRVQTFQGRDKAVVMATEVHLARGGDSDTFTVNVEELGPTPPGGLMDVIDDRAEW